MDGSTAVTEQPAEPDRSESPSGSGAPSGRAGESGFGRVWSVGAPWLGLVARLVLGGTLIAAGALKVVESPTEQVRAVKAYQLLPQVVEAPFAYALPIVEILLGIALVIGLGARIAAVLGGLLMLAFVVGVGSAWARGLTIDCGCFGGGGQVRAAETAYLQEILRDIGLMVAAACVVMIGPGRFALADRRPSG